MIIPIPVAQMADGSLIPHPGGMGMANANIQQEPGHPKTAIIAFAGMNQAVVNFDETGLRIINYTILNPGATLQVQNTVENIIKHLTQPTH